MAVKALGMRMAYIKVQTILFYPLNLAVTIFDRNISDPWDLISKSIAEVSIKEFQVVIFIFGSLATKPVGTKSVLI